MHVLELGPYPPPEGGINRNILAIREELRRMGHRCSIVATSRSTKITPEPDVFHPQTPFELIRAIRSIEFDVMHLHVGGDVTLRVLGLMAICGALGRGRSVLTLHSGGYPESPAGRRTRPSSMRGAIFRRFSRVISVNEAIDKVMAKYAIPDRRRSVISPFVQRVPDPEIPIPQELLKFVETCSPFLLTVGLLEPEYDLELQIDALGDVLQQYPTAGLMIMGSGSLEKQLRELTFSKPYSDRLFIAGDVPHAVTLHLIDRADTLLRTTTFDGDAISVREALFLGTPVIATDNGMRPDGVNLVSAGDPEGLVKQVTECVSQPKRTRGSLVADTTNIAAVLNIYSELMEGFPIVAAEAVG